MHRLIRFYNQNKKDIWKVIGVIIAIIVILQMLNYISKKNNEKQLQEKKENNNTYSNINQKYNSIELESEKSVLSGKEISDTKKDSTQIIDDFFGYCNEQKIQEAYELLTDECKEEMYSSVQVFKETYYDKVLNGQKKNISIENWTDNIYKVTISDDFLSSGKYTKENDIQDYITIKDNKLNINKYIGREEINKEKNEENVNICVIQKDEYMDYTTYTFEITNNSKGSILLDPLEDIDTMYIKDSKGVKYSAYTHEISKGSLLINEANKKQIKIKYYSKFVSSKNIKKIVFSKVMLNNKYYELEIQV